MSNMNEESVDISINDINIIIDHFNNALTQIPKYIESSAAVNDIHHLLSVFTLNTDLSDSHPDEFPETIEGITQFPDSILSFSLKQTDNSSRNQSAASSTIEFKEKQTSSATQFLLRLLSHKPSIEPLTSTLSSIPSVDSTNDEQNVDTSALQVAEKEIQQLSEQGPAGILHLSPLSHIVNRKIQVWTSSMNLYHQIGNKRPGEAINIQYHTNPDGLPGHWTLLNNEEPKLVERTLNNCLFDVIASQTGRKASELRDATIQRMQKCVLSLAGRIQVLAQEKECGRIVVMVGGARYVGVSACDAQQIIDASQNGRCHPGNQRGHPRGHSSDPKNTQRDASAESYSRNGWKTAFNNRQEQNDIAHRILISPAAQKAMKELNNGGESRTIRVPASQLKDPPKGLHFNDGVMGQSSRIKELVLVLRHHAGHAKDPDYDVFVHTFYPVLET